MRMFRSLLLNLLTLFLLPPGTAFGQQKEKPAVSARPPAQKPGAPSPPGVGEGGKAAAPELNLSELQRLRLREKQLQFALEQDKLQAAILDFNGECEKVRIENQWPEGTRCALDNLSIHPPEKPEEKPPAVSSQPSAKPPEPKK